MEMDAERWRYTNDYVDEVFGGEDEHLRELRAEALREGLPPIAVSAAVGRLLALLVGLAGPRRALEVGTLGGYSATWIARALPAGGRLYTLEREPRFARFAERLLARADLGQKVSVLTGAALELLPRLAAELGPESLGFVFIDAEKTEYPAYWSLIAPLLAPGGVLVVDNALGAGSWWIDQLRSPERQGVDRLNRTVAADPDLLATMLPLREGVLVARRRFSAG